jgi:hypothetical protein
MWKLGKCLELVVTVVSSTTAEKNTLNALNSAVISIKKYNM